MKKNVNRLLALILALLMLVSILTACGGGSGGSAKSTPIRVGSKDFTENLIVAEIYSLALEDAGYKVERKFNLASSTLHTTIVNNEIDLYPEYTGTGLLTVLKHDMVTDPDEVYKIVKEAYAKDFNLIWLNYAPANDGQGIVVTKKVSDAYGVKTLSDLQANADKLRFASNGEFDVRDDGLPALAAAYGPFSWKSSSVYDNALKYTVLENGEADATVAYTTEGALADPQFVLLEDDKRVWPPYNLAPVVRKEILDLYPEIADVLNTVDASLTTEVLTQLNAKVDLDGEEYETVAKDYLNK